MARSTRLAMLLAASGLLSLVPAVLDGSGVVLSVAHARGSDDRGSDDHSGGRDDSGLDDHGGRGRGTNDVGFDDHRGRGRGTDDVGFDDRHITRHGRGREAEARGRGAEGENHPRHNGSDDPRRLVYEAIDRGATLPPGSARIEAYHQAIRAAAAIHPPTSVTARWMTRRGW